MAKFPTDIFDEPPPNGARVGAHRARRSPGRAWIIAAVSVTATVLLTIVGLTALSLLEQRFELPILARPPSAEPAPEAEEPAQEATAITDPATLDPEFLQELTIAVLNGTPTEGLGTRVAESIAAAGWPTPAASAASSSDVSDTVVYYDTSAAENYAGIALGIAVLLGTDQVSPSDAFLASKITVVLGMDYRETL